jgi:hypothetical protein
VAIQFQASFIVNLARPRLDVKADGFFRDAAVAAEIDPFDRGATALSVLRRCRRTVTDRYP